MITTFCLNFDFYRFKKKICKQQQAVRLRKIRLVFGTLCLIDLGYFLQNVLLTFIASLGLHVYLYILFLKAFVKLRKLYKN